MASQMSDEVNWILVALAVSIALNVVALMTGCWQ